MGALAVAGWALSAPGDTLRREVGVAGWARSLHGKQLGARGGARRLQGLSSHLIDAFSNGYFPDLVKED